jgi:Zn-dependent peptidase ImmA (M78 family)
MADGSYQHEGGRRRWTTTDISMMQQWYGVAPAADLAAYFGVSERAMREQARRMGIKAEENRWKQGAPSIDELKRREGYVLDIRTAPHTRSARAIVRASRPDGSEAA